MQEQIMLFVFTQPSLELIGGCFFPQIKSLLY